MSWLDPASPLPPDPVRRRVPSVWLDVRRSYEELGREIADGVAALWAWSPPWSPSDEVLDEIRREAGAFDEGEADNQVIEQEAWSLATSNRWGEGPLEVIDESVTFTWPPLTAETVAAWVSRALSVQLTDEQRALLRSAYGQHSVHTRRVGDRVRFYLDRPVK